MQEESARRGKRLVSGPAGGSEKTRFPSAAELAAMISMRPAILVPPETRARAAAWFHDLREGRATPGGRFGGAISAGMTDAACLGALLDTKLPQIFAESEVAGDGSDWNLTELGLLGDISIAVPVTVFDDGRHRDPAVHEPPFSGELVFTPGALLRNGRGCEPADWAEVTTGGKLDADGYFALYRRRLTPVFRHIDRRAAALGKSALVTVPGLGCGQFAGPFAGRLGAALQTVLERFLAERAAEFPHIRAVWFDPYDECENARLEFAGISLLVRPLRRGNGDTPQLCPPVRYRQTGDDFSNCLLFSIVAWDHVSWPGNDFFGGSRATDDGVKAAATDSMAAITGVAGSYDKFLQQYQAPEPFRTWGEVVARRGLKLSQLAEEAG
jgi:hypothetical protein